MATEAAELYEELSYGQDFVGEFIVYDDDPPTIPTNLTGYTAKMEFRKKADLASTPVFTLTTANGGIELDTNTSQVYWKVSAAQTKLHQGILYTELRLIDPNGKNAPAVWGRIKIVFRGTDV